jgi:hypothetical protein
VPKLVSNTYLQLYLAQLKQSGYSIFIIHGQLPPCVADERLLNTPIDPAYFRSLTERANTVQTNKDKPSAAASGSTSNFDDQELQRAIKASVELDNSEDKALQAVLAQSLRDAPEVDDADALNQKLLAEAIAASLENDAAESTNNSAAAQTTAKPEPTVEGKLTSSLSTSL